MYQLIPATKLQIYQTYLLCLHIVTPLFAVQSIYMTSLG